MVTQHNQSTAMPVQKRSRWLGFAYFLSACVLLGSGAALVIKADPVLVPQAVDTARMIAGPEAVGMVESLVFQAQDAVRSAHYQATGSAAQVQWAEPATTLGAAKPTSKVLRDQLPTTAPTASVPLGRGGAIAPQTTQLTWSPYMNDATGQPLLERTIVQPDPTRPYVAAALVRIDLQRADLHMLAGTEEPMSHVHTPRPGVIPTSAYPQLLAAFNGGFKAVSGAFGMGVNSVTLLPPKDGLATLGFYRNGQMRLGVWGTDMSTTPDLVSFRQNCPLLVDHGTVTDQTNSDDPTVWGRTVGNKVATWRSGLGLSADGRYLIYAAGDGLTVPSLAATLAQGGADRAMQLDINSFWTRFVSYDHSASGQLVAEKLVTSMAGDARQFLVPDSRDFFYVTAKTRF